MGVILPTIKRLFAKSSNRCAMPRCNAPIILSGIPVGEICHIKARSKNGPRFSPNLTPTEKDAYSNLLLLCRTCHKLIDSDQKTYSWELLTEIKQMHEAEGALEITPQMAKDAALLLPAAKPRAKASASGQGIAIAIGGDNHGPISISHAKAPNIPKSRYPANSIGADANFSGYIEYLFGLGIDYWKGVPLMTPGRLGKKIKTKFRLKAKTRLHLGVQRFEEVVTFIINEILMKSPVGKVHQRNGTRICRTFEEWRQCKM